MLHKVASSTAKHELHIHEAKHELQQYNRPTSNNKTKCSLLLGKLKESEKKSSNDKIQGNFVYLFHFKRRQNTTILSERNSEHNFIHQHGSVSKCNRQIWKNSLLD